MEKQKDKSNTDTVHEEEQCPVFKYKKCVFKILIAIFIFLKLKSICKRKKQEE